MDGKTAGTETGEAKMLTSVFRKGKCPQCSQIPDTLPLNTDPPMKENPYEDIELHGRCLGKKCVLNFPASPTSSIPDTLTKV